MIRALLRHTRWPIAALAFALAGAGAMLPAQTAPGRPRPEPAMPGGPFAIAGVVVSSKTGAPLGRALVTIIDTANPGHRAATLTGDDGRFEFEHLSAGKYSLQGERRGFLPTSYEQHGQFSTAIVTGPGFETQDLTLRLVPTALISGHIYDEAGEPVRKAQVEIYRVNHGLGVARVDPAGGAQSDDRGYFDLPASPGTYYVSAEAQPWYAVHPRRLGSSNAGSAVEAVDPSLDVTYPVTFYADTTESDAATPVVLKGGDHAQVDIHLSPVRSLHVLLHVPVGGFPFPSLETRVFDSMQPVRNAEQSGGLNLYEITGVPAGRYTVRMHSRSGDGEQITEINLTQDGQELDASQGEPLGSVTLSLKIAGEEKLPDQLFVNLIDSRLQPMREQVDAKGEAHFQSLRAGKYRIAVFGPGKRYVVSQTSTPGSGPGSAPGSATTGNSFELAQGAALSLTALLVSGTARVEGIVKRAGKPAAGAMVVLVPTGAASGVELFRRDQSDFDGSFTLRDVAPGSYTVIAIENGWTLDWSTPAVLARYTPSGEKLTISPQTQGAVTLPDAVEVQPR